MRTPSPLHDTHSGPTVDASVQVDRTFTSTENNANYIEIIDREDGYEMMTDLQQTFQELDANLSRQDILKDLPTTNNNIREAVYMNTSCETGDYEEVATHNGDGDHVENQLTMSKRAEYETLQSQYEQTPEMNDADQYEKLSK